MIRSYLDGDLPIARVVLVVLVIFFGVGVAGHANEQTYTLMLSLTPWILFAAGTLVAASGIRSWRRIDVIWFLVTYGVTFALEAIGTATGQIFGPYVYGTVLGLSFLNVPLVIGFNWVLVILGSTGVAGLVTRGLEGHPVRPYVDAGLAALLAVAFDWLLEPLAVSLNYWTWTDGSIPVRNYLAWGVIAFTFALVHRLAGAKRGRFMLVGYFFLQAAFFAALRIAGV